MEQPIVNPDHTAEAQGLEVGDTVCYIKQWVQSIALVRLGKVTEVTCPTIVRVEWLGGTERLQFVRHLVKLEDEEAIVYLEEYKSELEKEQSRQDARDKLRDCVEQDVAIEKAVTQFDRPRKRCKPEASVAPPKPHKSVVNPLKKKSASSRRSSTSNLKSRMLKRRQ